MFSKKQKLPPLSKEQIKQVRVSTLHALEDSYPGMVAFHKQKTLALRIAFALRIALNVLVAILSMTLGGSPGAAAGLVPGLFIAWAFYMAMVYGGWQGCILILVWAGMALFDSLPVLLDFPQYYFWAVCLFSFEFLCGIVFLILGGWLCFSKKSRTYSTAYANACKQTITAEQQNLLSNQGSNWLR